MKYFTDKGIENPLEEGATVGTTLMYFSLIKLSRMHFGEQLKELVTLVMKRFILKKKNQELSV